MFLSKACAFVTSLDTTKAFTGCASLPFIASASWFVPDAPTTLNAGACAADVPPPPPLPTLGLLAENPDLFGFGVETILLICVALKAAANPACTIGYAGKKAVIGDFCAVVNAF